MTRTSKHVRPLYILLAEVDFEVRAAIRNAIAGEPAFRLVTVCSKKCEALQAVQQAALDIALVGLKLSDGSGLEVVEAMRRRHPASEALVIATADDQDAILSFRQAGATGFLWKEALLRPEAAHAISMFARLSSIRMPGTHSADEINKAPVESSSDLSPMQRRILHCLLRGLSNKEIARDLLLTSYNVDYHLKCLRKRFLAHNRVQLVGAARTLGL